MKNILCHFSETTKAFVFVVVFIFLYDYTLHSGLFDKKIGQNNELTSLIIEPPTRVENLYDFIPENQESQFTNQLESVESICQFNVSSVIVGNYRFGQCPSNLTFLSADFLDRTEYTPYVTILLEIAIESSCDSLANVTFNIPYYENILNGSDTVFSIDYIFLKSGFNQIKTILQVDKFTNNDLYRDFVPLLTDLCTKRANRDETMVPLQRKRTCTPTRRLSRSYKLSHSLHERAIPSRPIFDRSVKHRIDIGVIGDIFSDVAGYLPGQIFDKIGGAAEDIAKITRNPVSGTLKLAFSGLVDNLLALKDFGKANIALIDVIVKVFRGSKAPLHILFAYAKTISPLVRSPPAVLFITSKNNPIAPIFDAFNNSLEKLLLPEIIESVDNQDEIKSEITDAVVENINGAANETQKEFFCDSNNFVEYITQCLKTQPGSVCNSFYRTFCSLDA